MTMSGPARTACCCCCYILYFNWNYFWHHSFIRMLWSLRTNCTLKTQQNAKKIKGAIFLSHALHFWSFNLTVPLNDWCFGCLVNMYCAVYVPEHPEDAGSGPLKSCYKTSWRLLRTSSSSSKVLSIRRDVLTAVWWCRAASAELEHSLLQLH